MSAGSAQARTRSSTGADTLAKLPHNLDAERSILGAIVLDNSAFNVATAVIQAGEFFLPQNRTIFDCMTRLAAKREPIDAVTLMDDLERLGELEAAGGVAYLSQLADGVPRVSNVAHYARIVKDKAILRAIAYSAEAIKTDALDGGESADAVLSRADERLANLCANSGLTVEPRAWRDVFHSFADFEVCAPLSFSIGGFLQNEGATMI